MTTKKEVFKIIAAQQGISSVKIAELSNKSLRTANRAVKKIIDSKLIEYKGSKKTGGYYITDASE